MKSSLFLAVAFLALFVGVANGQEPYWHLPDLKPRAEENARPSAIAWSGDASLLAVADGDIAVFDVKAKKKLWQKSRRDWAVRWPTFSFSPDGKYLAVNVLEGTLILESRTGELVTKLGEEGRSAICWGEGEIWLLARGSIARYSHSGKTFAFKEKVSNYFFRNLLAVEKTVDGRILVIHGYTGGDYAIVDSWKDGELKGFCAKKGKFLAARAGKTIFQPRPGEWEIHSLAEGKKLAGFSLAEQKDRHFNFSSCGNYLAIGGFDGKAYLYDATGKQKLAVAYGTGFGTGGNWITSIAASSSGIRFAVGGTDGVKVYAIK
ncbi:MAG TPA: WD40 repeat domain-containing protein [Negativicutes bacterium]|nr:WD40 repeat domain-containing protein [Negativicutes bacterium]